MITNLILLITGLISFVTAGLIIKNHRLNSAMNIYIILIILIISTRFFLSGLTHFIADDSFNSNYLKYSVFSSVIFPLFYLYYRNLSNPNLGFEKKELLHFVFPLFFSIFIVYIHFFEITPKGFSSVLYFMFFLYLVYYLVLCYKLLKQSIWIKKNTLKIVKKQNVLNSKWTYFLFLASLIIVVRLFISIFFELQEGSRLRGFRYQWVSAVIWLFVLYKLIVSPEILYGYETLLKKIDDTRTENINLNSIWDRIPNQPISNVQHLQLRDKITPTILTYIEDVEKISIEDKLFRNPTTSMIDIANKLNIPKSHVSYLFKYHSTISFSEYKKVIRIQDAINLINEDYLKNHTLDYLSKTVGFPSYNTFFTSFKDITGISPIEYSKTDKRDI